jgi:hypothetical protein
VAFAIATSRVAAMATLMAIGLTGLVAAAVATSEAAGLAVIGAVMAVNCFKYSDFKLINCVLIKLFKLLSCVYTMTKITPS